VAEITDSAVILSLGGGVQSTALVLMAAVGDLPRNFRRPSAAIFADTGWEPASVYGHLRWLVQTLGTTLPVHIVRAMRPDGTPVHIREDSEAIVRGETGRFANPPLFVKESVEYTPYRDPRQQANFEAHLIRRGEIPRFVTMPVFARAFTGARPVMLRRQCTGDYKIEPIYRFCKTLIGRRRGQRHYHAALL
jgi:3'-phosphoadenosine 5'-phosphosulfate sulfotransferase (PAPS reductase)/FAD synthetase